LSSCRIFGFLRRAQLHEEVSILLVLVVSDSNLIIKYRLESHASYPFGTFNCACKPIKEWGRGEAMCIKIA
jgi:hypothetical protein